LLIPLDRVGPSLSFLCPVHDRQSTCRRGWVKFRGQSLFFRHLEKGRKEKLKEQGKDLI
jgi:hypothetical protein